MLRSAVLGVAALLTAVAIAAGAPARAADATPGCGGYNESKCEFAAAVSSGKAQKLGCGGGQFIDPRKGGECWSCPKGYVRTLTPVTDKRACAKDLLFGPWAAAKYHRSVWGCPAGTFLDVGLGSCWSCPADHNRSIHPVNGPQACTVAAQLTCDAGLAVNITNGRCMRDEASVLQTIQAYAAKAESLRPLHDCMAVPARKDRFIAALTAQDAQAAGAAAFECLDAATLASLGAVPDGASRPLAAATTGSACAYDGYNTLTIGAVGPSIQLFTIGAGAEFGIAINLSPCRKEPFRRYTTIEKGNAKVPPHWPLGLAFGVGVDVLPIGLSYATNEPGVSESNGIVLAGKFTFGGAIGVWWDTATGADDGFSVAFGLGFSVDLLSEHLASTTIYE